MKYKHAAFLNNVYARKESVKAEFIKKNKGISYVDWQRERNIKICNYRTQLLAAIPQGEAAVNAFLQKQALELEKKEKALQRAVDELTTARLSTLRSSSTILPSVQEQIAANEEAIRAKRQAVIDGINSYFEAKYEAIMLKRA